MEPEAVDQIVDRYGAQPSYLLSILQDIQAAKNYLPRPALDRVSDRLGVSMARIYSLASFFRALNLEPRGEHICTVCVGTACHVRAAQRILDELERGLGIKSGETTADQKYTIESVNCVGACALGPLIIVDGKYQGNMTPSKVKRMLKKMTAKK